MKKFNISGMSCAACSLRVEKAVAEVSGVTSCSVNLLANTLTFEGDVSDGAVIKAVEDAGYKVVLKNEPKSDITPIKKRLVSSVVLLIILMYFSMGHMIGISYPSYITPKVSGYIQLVLSLIIIIINNKFFISGFKSITGKSPSMDSLVAIGAGASFIYSVFALLNLRSSSHHNTDFYFESAAMILTLITVGKMLEERAKGKTLKSLESLMKLAPETAVLIKDGKEITVKISDVKRGDIFKVFPGASVPVDGIVINGESSVNESALTGESLPVYKEKGTKVYSATVNMSGYLECEATEVGEDTTLSKIIKMVSDASSSKAPIAKIADKISAFFVPVIMIIALITSAIWILLTKDTGFALARGISVLVISCPCALGLATPVAIMVGSGLGARNNILFKNATSLENAGRIKTVILDKTGTVTKGEPEITDILPFDEISLKELLKLAYSIELKSEHPLSRAIVKKAEEEEVTPYEIDGFESVTGNGVFGFTSGKRIACGNLDFIKKDSSLDEDMIKKASLLSEEGKTPLFVSFEDKFCGIIAVADTVKEDSKDAIKEIKDMGINVVMLTGDNDKTAQYIGSRVGISEIYAKLLPEDKKNIVYNISKKNKVAMVGDGINDAPALAASDVGIAIGAGTDVAIDAADIVLTSSSLSDLTATIRLGRATLKNIKENLFWAFFYNILGIPLAAGVFINITGWTLNPMIGAAMMSLSSLFVVSNALRLNFIKIKNTNNKELVEMEKVLNVEGMMCPHCEARVKKALEELSFVKEAYPSHEKGIVRVILTEDISEDLLKEKIEAEGYKVN